MDTVHAVNPLCEVLSTRKLMPGTKPFDVKALTVGGAFPHRLGLSETVLAFDHHLTFCGGLEKFIADVSQLKAINPHVTLIAAGGVNLGNAVEYAATGMDGLATTCLHFAKPLDMSARMSALLESVAPGPSVERSHRLVGLRFRVAGSA